MASIGHRIPVRNKEFLQIIFNDKQKNIIKIIFQALTTQKYHRIDQHLAKTDSTNSVRHHHRTKQAPADASETGEHQHQWQHNRTREIQRRAQEKQIVHHIHGALEKHDHRAFDHVCDEKMRRPGTGD